MKKLSLTTGALTAIAGSALLTAVAFAASDATSAKDTDGGRGLAIAKLAHTTTATGEAKGDIISAAAKAMATTNGPADVDKDNDHGKADNDKDNDNDKVKAKTDADRHGDTISALARKTAPGPEHGETVSAAASANRHSTTARTHTSR
jgi:hypothetical protein